MNFELHLGDCLDAMRAMADNSVDSIVTDPPYGLRFMGKRWDCDVPRVEVWVECLRVLKPGGHLLAFAGTRTQHRMAVRIEDAGFEIRDMIAWVYGSGFPKSRNIGKDVEAMAGWGTALKPSLEPITVARKPLIGTVAANILAHGTRALNIDDCRVEPTGEGRERIGEPSQKKRYIEAGGTNFAAKPGVRGGDPSGRWPANLIHDGSDEVLAAFPDAPGQQGDLKGHSKDRKSKGIFGDMAAARDAIARNDSGSAARFFYCAKTSRADRHEGLEDPGAQFAQGNTLRKVALTDTKGNNHPTVKPTDLMAYLLRLVTPPKAPRLTLSWAAAAQARLRCAKASISSAASETRPTWRSHGLASSTNWPPHSGASRPRPRTSSNSACSHREITRRLHDPHPARTTQAHSRAGSSRPSQTNRWLRTAQPCRAAGNCTGEEAMSTDNADDQALIEAHARFVALDQDGMIDAADEFQESAYALGLARGRLEAEHASVSLPPLPELPEEPLFADDDSHMDAYHAARRMRTACAKAITPAGLKVEPWPCSPTSAPGSPPRASPARS